MHYSLNWWNALMLHDEVLIRSLEQMENFYPIIAWHILTPSEPWLSLGLTICESGRAFKRQLMHTVFINNIE